jgi:hypothetical protein
LGAAGEAEGQHAVGNVELGGSSREIHPSAGPDIVGIVSTSLPNFWRARQTSLVFCILSQWSGQQEALRCSTVEGGGENCLDAAGLPLRTLDPGSPRLADDRVDFGSTPRPAQALWQPRGAQPNPDRAGT